MYQERLKFEVYLELLTQVKYGNCHYAGLKKCTQLSEAVLDQTMAPLISERLLNVDIDAQDEEIRFSITDKGEQFIDFLRLAFYFVELQVDNSKKG